MSRNNDSDLSINKQIDSSLDQNKFSLGGDTSHIGSVTRDQKVPGSNPV